MSVAGAAYAENREAKLASIKDGSVVTIYGNRYSGRRRQVDKTIIAESAVIGASTVFVGTRVYKNGKFANRNAYVISNHDFKVENS